MTSSVLAHFRIIDFIHSSNASGSSCTTALHKSHCYCLFSSPYEMQLIPQRTMTSSVMSVTSPATYCGFRQLSTRVRARWTWSFSRSTSNTDRWTLLRHLCDVSNITDDVDEQYCKMKFGSWTFSERQVTLEWYEDYRQVNSVSLWAGHFAWLNFSVGSLNTHLHSQISHDKDFGLSLRTICVFLLSDCLLLDVVLSLSLAPVSGTLFLLTSLQHLLCSLSENV